jgi:cathepsin L
MPHEEKSFLSWMRTTNQFYTGDEYQVRFGIWLSNSRFVREHNAAGKSFKVSMNKLACMTPAEYRVLLGVRGGVVKAPITETVKSVTAADVDWRTKGVVNPIKDQGQCGSCWAFSAIQGAESADAIKTGKLQSFSESNLVDCVDTCFGCEGGWPSDAYDYVIGTQGGKFNLESDYPYVPVTGTCKFDASKGVGSISSILNVQSGSEDDLTDKCKTVGPVSVCIDAGHASFQMYMSGIYDEPDCSTSSLDHAVGCLGYGTDGGVTYWIVRNSWGTVWGEQGYIRMSRYKQNQCGIATQACIPVP